MGKWTRDLAVLLVALGMMGAATGMVAYGATMAANRVYNLVAGTP